MTYPEFDDGDVPVDTSIDPDLTPPGEFSDDWGTPGVEDRRVVGELIEVEEEDDPDPRLQLTREEREDLSTLLTVGRRLQTIKVADHKVTIRTLKTADEMRIGLYTKPYLDSQGFARAYQVGVCAAGIVEIPNQPLWSSFKEITDPDEIFEKNVKALEEFFPITVTQIYQAIMDLEREFAELAIKLNLINDPAKKLVG